MYDINLLPKELSDSNKSKNYTIIIIPLAILVIMTALYFAIDLMDDSVQKNINQVEKELAPYQDIESRQIKLNNLKSEVEIINLIINNITQDNTNQLDLLEKIEKSTPQGIQFTEQISSEGTMVIRGQAEKEIDVSLFTAKLYELDVTDIWINTTEFGEEIIFEVFFTYDQQERVEE